jgi:CheY-like chemotaxis protein
MPIVDGLTSTKMIRSFEKTHPTARLSRRAALNGRVPIIAVSASLVEKEKQTYVDAGFDGWILKPISFPRLNKLMKGIVDAAVREEALYTPGGWERGGWFERARPERREADTKPDAEKPVSEENSAVREGEAREVKSDDSVNDYVDSAQLKSFSMPQLGRMGFPSKDEVQQESITGEEVRTPESINESQG